ncbi:hypothetical protein BDY21DRAFT_292566 [Lineolata rhizophorae]|uniref:PH domain-containing protein n=1 Tax=Lineolata rhizophorae TaxID=578093 RepID=A0A6A6NPY5_9PEZI|nr:hypothetical protein BDY21DRAFT_292566 [Lineolata rhizophorae]
MQVQTQEEQRIRNGHIGLDTFSPVNQNGSFEFDRVLKSGQVLKRTRKTKTWRHIHMVLRPNLLSLYKTPSESKLRHNITLSDLTAVARQRDPKRRARHVFALFSPSRNFYFAAADDADATHWVELIRREARIDDEDWEMMRRVQQQQQGAPTAAARRPSQAPSHAPSHATYIAYSGPDHGSVSDFSDCGPGPATTAAANAATASAAVGAGAFRDSSLSLTAGGHPPAEKQGGGANASQDDERVVCQGWLLLLKSAGGVRQWKKMWVVLRPKGLAMYKNEEEYSAHLILPFPALLDAVEIDPLSRSKQHCFQLIADDRNYRLCAPDDDRLARWLGALKSLLAKRRGGMMQTGVGGGAGGGGESGGGAPVAAG